MILFTSSPSATRLYLAASVLTLLIGLSHASHAQLMGGTVYPINGWNDPPASFSNITSAVSYLEAYGVTGTGQVVLELQPGYEGSEQYGVSIPPIPGASESLGITFRPGFVAQTEVAGTTARRFAIQICGSYITLDGRLGGAGLDRAWTIRCTGPGSTGAGRTAVRIGSLLPLPTVPQFDVTVEHCILEAEAANTQSAILAVEGGSTYPLQNIKLLNNLVRSTGASSTDCRGGGILLTNAKNASNTGAEIRGNLVDCTYSYGIKVDAGFPDILVCGNEVAHTATVSPATSNGFTAIHIRNQLPGARCYDNYVHDLHLAQHCPQMVGILLNVPLATSVPLSVYNNRVALGDDISWDCDLRGIIETSSQPGTTYCDYNSVYIGGVATTGASNSYAFSKDDEGIVSVRNNIFYNSRGNGAAATGTHYAIGVGNTNFASINNNDYFVDGNGGVLATTDFTAGGNQFTLEGWQSAVPMDTASISQNPNYVDPLGHPPDLRINDDFPTLLESGGQVVTGIDDDFEGDIRAGSPGYGGPGWAPDIGADEFGDEDVFPPSIAYSPLLNNPSTAGRVFSDVTVTDLSGVNGEAGTRPRVYYKRSVDPNEWQDNSSLTPGWKCAEADGSSSPFSFTIDYSRIHGGVVTEGDVVQYFVVAQDLATIPNVGINSGSFANRPATVALDSTAFPIGGAVNSYAIVTPEVTISDVVVVEGNSGTTAAVFTVTLDGTQNDTVRVSYSTADSTASVVDDDYVAASGVAVIPPGEVAATIAVQVVGDLWAEVDEVFKVILHDPVNALIADGLGLGWILNDDGPCVAPVANFDAEPLTGTAPLLVHFRDLSTGDPEQWLWDFENDGIYDSTDPNPDWTYPTPGERNVKLVVANHTGADSLIRYVYIEAISQVRFVGVSADSFPAQQMPFGDTTTHGTAWCDYDDDGHDDLFVCHPEAPNALYHNDGYGLFTRVMDQPPGVDAGCSWGATWGDYDNDGKPDLFVANRTGTNFLYRNLGSGDFARVAVPPLTTDASSAICCAWADMDGDGWLDLYVGNRGGPDFLYRNNGDGTFVRVFDSGLLGDHQGDPEAQWADVDNDGDPDLAVIGGWEGFILYVNDGLGRFARRFYDYGYLTSVTPGDYDNDGVMDFVLSSPVGNILLHNNAGGVPGQFEVITGSCLGWEDGASGASFADFDNDGHIDVLTVHATRAPYLFSNLGDGTFGRYFGVPPVMNPPSYDGASASWADGDGNGSLDLFYGCRSGGWYCIDVLYRNVSPARNWLGIRCQGTVSNRSAFGTKVRVKASVGAEACWQLREVASSSGASGQSGFVQHFGLGEAAIADSVVAQWPSGLVTTMVNVSANQTIVLTEPNQTVAQFAADPTTVPVNAPVSFRDYSLGDPTSWAWDLDGDGQDESTEQNPSFAYDTAGRYSVRLRVSGPHGEAERTRPDYITVYNMADFDVSDSLGMAPLSVQFTDRTDGEPTSWEWDFEDDGTPDSFEQNPLHEYTAEGLYSVRLTAVVEGETLSVVKPDLVRVLGANTVLIEPTTITAPEPTAVPFAYLGTSALGAVSVFTAWDNSVLEFEGIESRTPGEVFSAGIVGNEISVQWFDETGGFEPIMPGAGRDTLFVLLFSPRVSSGATQLVFDEPQCFLGNQYGDPIPDVTWFDSPPFGTVTIASGSIVSGRVGYYWEDKPVPGALLSLGPPVPDVTTDGLGDYEFEPCPMGNRILSIAKGGDANGLNSLDAIKVIRHSTGIEPLANPYKLIAANVNNDASINALDAIKIVRAAVGLEPLPSGDWWFEPDSAVFQPLQQDETVDFITVRMGDVNGDWESTLRGSPPMKLTDPTTSSLLGELRGRSSTIPRSALGLVLPDTTVDPAVGTIDVPLRVWGFDSVGAISLRIGFSTQILQYMDVISHVPGVTFVRNLVGEELRIEWYDGTGGANPITIGTGTLLSIRFGLPGAPGTSSPLAFGEFCAIGDAAGNPIADVEYVDGSCALLALTGVETLPVRPSGPAFSLTGGGILDSIELSFAVPHKTRATLALYDVSGRRIEVLLHRTIEPGWYNLRLGDAANLRGLGSGVYFARFEAGDFCRAIKFVGVR